MKTLFILSPGHGEDIKGKRSPEIPPGFEEWRFVRELAIGIFNSARAYTSFRVVDILNKNYKYNRAMTLKKRVEVSNQYAIAAVGNDMRPIHVAIHTNAAGNDGWYEANGTAAFTAKKCSPFASQSAKIIGDQISRFSGTLRREDRKVDFYELKHTIAPAALIEVLFHTSKKDCQIAADRKDSIIEAFIESFVIISKIKE